MAHNCSTTVDGLTANVNSFYKHIEARINVHVRVCVFVLCVCEYKRSSRGSGCLSEHNVTAAEQWLKSVNYAAWHGAKPIPDFSSFQYANHVELCIVFVVYQFFVFSVKQNAHMSI